MTKMMAATREAFRALRGCPVHVNLNRVSVTDFVETGRSPQRADLHRSAALISHAASLTCACAWCTLWSQLSWCGLKATGLPHP